MHQVARAMVFPVAILLLSSCTKEAPSTASAQPLPPPQQPAQTESPVGRYTYFPNAKREDGFSTGVMLDTATGKMWLLTPTLVDGKMGPTRLLAITREDTPRDGRPSNDPLGIR